MIISALQFMIFIEKLNTWYKNELTTFQEIPLIKKVFLGELTKSSYKAFIQEYYHFVQSAGPLYSLCASEMDHEYSTVREWFLQAAFKEAHHDSFILNDLEAMGVSSQQTRNSMPSPEMDALCSYNYGFLKRHHPVGMLGTPFLMLNLSTLYSARAAQNIKRSLELQEEGVSFFEAHGHLDKHQQDDISVIVQSVTDPAMQELIFLNAKTIFVLYQTFFKSLRA